jgi:ech hydrogenase subunit A
MLGMTHEWLIGALVLGPMALALLILAGPKGRLRDALVVLSALATMAVGVGVALRGNVTLSLPASITGAGTLIEPLIILVVLALGIRIRSWPVKLMAAAQLALAIAGLVLDAGHEAAETLVRVDALSIILVLIVSIVGSLIAIYAIGYMKHHEHHAPPTAASTNRFFFVMIAFLGLMNGLVLVDHLKWLAIFWEGTTLCSFFLIGHDGTEEARASARRALLINAFGGLMMSLAGFLAGRLVGSESMMAAMASPAAILPLALLAVATMTKSAQMPFQSWLLGAMVAPTPVSALLHSSTMVKAGSYLILRLAPVIDRTPLAPMIAIAGAFTFAVACALAVGQSNGKKVLAYSTIANLGLIAACAALNTPLAFAAALMLLIFHAVTKALLFLCVGTIEQSIGSRHIEDMGGILFKMPLTTSVAIVGMVSMMAPPFGMLVAKWMAIESAIGSPVVLMLVIIGSALTVFFWAKWLGRITTTSYHEHYTIEKVGPSQSGVLVALALAVLAGSLCAMPIYHFVVKPISLAVFGALGSTPDLMTMLDSVEAFMAWPIMVVLGMVLLALGISSLVFRRSQLRLPYLCGENVPDGAFSFEFRSVADGVSKALVNSYYLSPVLGERNITAWCNPVAAILILTLFGVLIP